MRAARSGAGGAEVSHGEGGRRVRTAGCGVPSPSGKGLRSSGTVPGRGVGGERPSCPRESPSFPVGTAGREGRRGEPPRCRPACPPRGGSASGGVCCRQIPPRLPGMGMGGGGRAAAGGEGQLSARWCFLMNWEAHPSFHTANSRFGVAYACPLSLFAGYPGRLTGLC